MRCSPPGHKFPENIPVYLEKENAKTASYSHSVLSCTVFHTIRQRGTLFFYLNTARPVAITPANGTHCIIEGMQPQIAAKNCPRLRMRGPRRRSRIPVAIRGGLSSQHQPRTTPYHLCHPPPFLRSGVGTPDDNVTHGAYHRRHHCPGHRSP